MIRLLATSVYVLCLTGWCILALFLIMTIAEHGFNAVPVALLHVGGGTGVLGESSGRAVAARLLTLLAITIVAGCVRAGWRRRSSVRPLQGS
jgi:hypothetical protein